MRRPPYPSAPISARRGDATQPQTTSISCARGSPQDRKAHIHKRRRRECAVCQQASLQSYTPHSILLISYKCKGTERQISRLALHLLKGHQGNVIFPCEQRYQKLMKPELHHCCLPFLFSFHLEMNFLSPSQDNPGSHKCYARMIWQKGWELCIPSFFFFHWQPWNSVIWQRNATQFNVILVVHRKYRHSSSHMCYIQMHKIQTCI